MLGPFGKLEVASGFTNVQFFDIERAARQERAAKKKARKAKRRGKR
jgi:hypothetical protein